MNTQTLKPELKNPEMKAMFFAQYWGQEIQTYKLTYSWRRNVKVDGSAMGFITLTPLEHITDEDALAVAIISGIKPENILTIEEAEGEIIVDRSNEFGDNIIVKYWFQSIGETTEWELRDFTIYTKNGDISDAYGCSNNIASAVDFFRSKGYAIDWNGYKVEELIEAGYCQLKPIEQNTASNSIEKSIELGELKGGEQDG